MRRRGAVHPVIFAAVPGPASIVTPPVIADAEGHNADAKLRAEIEHRDAAVLIVVVQIAAVDPAAIAFPIDIAPSPIVETAADVEQGIARNGSDDGVIGARTRPQMHDALGVRGARRGGSRECNGNKRGEGGQISTHGFTCKALIGPRSLCRLRLRRNAHACGSPDPLRRGSNQIAATASPDRPRAWLTR